MKIILICLAIMIGILMLTFIGKDGNGKRTEKEISLMIFEKNSGGSERSDSE
ncbi:hypothetical protein N8813_01185 [bacterium]|jgi:hypothetical protein|nr:hypothetical protein [bacterium]MDC0321835.1 hypothetical protein [Verrucomicrobiales bacterium]